MWTRKNPYQSVKKIPLEIPESSPEWDQKNANRLLRILNMNMHGRPVNLINDLNKGVECDPEYHVANGQERRMRGFFEWLDRLAADSKPHVLCFQEIMWKRIIVIAERELKLRGYECLPSISLSKDLGCDNCLIPKTGSGLGIYIDVKSGLKMVNGGGFRFNNVLGTDILTNKGMKWALIFSSALNVYFIVVTMHPQAYQELRPDAAPNESLKTWFLRKVVSVKLQWMGGYPLAVTTVHEEQYTQVGNFLKRKLVPICKKLLGNKLVGLFVSADLNINMYATEPDSMEESDPLSYQRGISREFALALKTLGMDQPAIIKDRLNVTPKGGLYTWNTADNLLARPLGILKRPQFGWIDSVLYANEKIYGIPAPLYMDNRALAVRTSAPFPELSEFWTTRCSRVRRNWLTDPFVDDERVEEYKLANNAKHQRLELGRKQFEATVEEYKRLYPAESYDTGLFATDEWRDLILNSPFEKTSQLWKGLDFYRILKTDFGAEKLESIPIGQPQGFNLIQDVSDHMAVLARILLPTF